MRTIRMFILLSLAYGCATAGSDLPVDADGDGFPSDEDCDDDNAAAHPGADETCRDEFDLNCDGLVDYIPWPTTCEIHLVEQGRFSDLDLTGTGLEVGSISVNGSAVKSGINHELEDFLGFTEEQIASTFSNYVASHGPFTEETIVILDIEHPVHPREFHNYLDSPELFSEIIDAFRRRITVARSILPKNPIALYGVVVPHGQGSETGFAGSNAGYQAAIEHGLYDELDHIVPVIYHRFGATDPNYENRLDLMTHQALGASAALTRSDGSALPLFPLLSLQVFNGNSNHGGQAPLPEQVDAIIEDLLLYPEVELFGFWTANDTSSPVGDIPEFFESVSMVPIPDCRCPEVEGP
ncbi:MAG: putative metal-binding motif-containing protein [Myxococcota bacterium]|nr:putative metal-binding motif-containing protein [Myxococcota bacterium]